MASEQLAYCMSCKSKHPIKDAREDVMKNGRPLLKGKCSKCNGNVSVIPSKSK